MPHPRKTSSTSHPGVFLITFVSSESSSSSCENTVISRQKPAEYYLTNTACLDNQLLSAIFEVHVTFGWPEQPDAD